MKKPPEKTSVMKTSVKTKRLRDEVTPSYRLRPGQRFRAAGLTQARALLLRCLLRDARLERCVQLVP